MFLTAVKFLRNFTAVFNIKNARKPEACAHRCLFSHSSTLPVPDGPGFSDPLGWREG